MSFIGKVEFTSLRSDNEQLRNEIALRDKEIERLRSDREFETQRCQDRNTAYENDINQLEIEIERLRKDKLHFEHQMALGEAKIEQLREALGFARSVIKSGEPWTDECEIRLGSALRGRS